MQYLNLAIMSEMVKLEGRKLGTIKVSYEKQTVAAVDGKWAINDKFRIAGQSARYGAVVVGRVNQQEQSTLWALLGRWYGECQQRGVKLGLNLTPNKPIEVADEPLNAIEEAFVELKKQGADFGLFIINRFGEAKSEHACALTLAKCVRL